MLNFDTYEKLGLCVTSNDERVLTLQICKEQVDIGIAFVDDNTLVSVNGFSLSDIDQLTKLYSNVVLSCSENNLVKGCTFTLTDNFIIKADVNYIQDAITGNRAIPETIDYITVIVKPSKAKPYTLIIKHGTLTFNDQPLNTVNLGAATLKKLLENLVVK